MAIELPAVIARYFAIDREGCADAVAQCFTQDAVVRDEGKSHVGRDAICNWKQEAGSAYTYAVEPCAIASEGDQIVVTSHLSGNFPGSPVDLRYLFALDGNLIASLEIIP